MEATVSFFLYILLIKMDIKTNSIRGTEYTLVSLYQNNRNIRVNILSAFILLVNFLAISNYFNWLFFYGKFLRPRVPLKSFKSLLKKKNKILRYNDTRNDDQILIYFVTNIRKIFANDFFRETIFLPCYNMLRIPKKNVQESGTR